MYKLVLGIVVVGILQFAFVMYTRLQEPVDVSLAQVNSDFEPAFSEPVFPDVYAESPETKADEPISVAADRDLTPVYRSSDRVYAKARSNRRSQFLRARYDSARKALPEDFSTVVISYNVRATPRDCGSRENDKPAKVRNKAQYAATSGERWQVITTDFTRYN